MNPLYSLQDMGNYIFFCKNKAGELVFQMDLGNTEPNDDYMNSLVQLMGLIFENARRQQSGNEILKQINKS